VRLLLTFVTVAGRNDGQIIVSYVSDGRER